MGTSIENYRLRAHFLFPFNPLQAGLTVLPGNRGLTTSIVGHVQMEIAFL